MFVENFKIKFENSYFNKIKYSSNIHSICCFTKKKKKKKKRVLF